MSKDIVKTAKIWATSSAAVVFFLSSAEMRAQSGSEKFVPFDEFLSSTAAAVYNSASKAANMAAFEEMRQHLLKMYTGVHAAHSFVIGSQTYDCMPIEQQPSVRLLGLKGIAAPPTPSARPAQGAAEPNNSSAPSRQAAVSSTLPATGVDRFGNAIGCQDKTVPIGRTTLEHMSTFPTLKAFLSKSPDSKGQPPVPNPSKAGGAIPPEPVLHKHDFTYQYVYNLGGNSYLSVNNPYVYTPWGEVFSLSQVWYIGFNAGTMQTVEAGWTVYPDRYLDEQPHLFAYWTADQYHNTGCYDYSCGAFVQSSGSVFLGGALSPVSVPGGAQSGISIVWEWWSGNWWLKVNDTWVGYYPGWLFGAGDMATHSDLVEFGGEIVGGNGTSYNYYPPMGSGNWGTDGWPWAAFQGTLWYFDGSYNGHWATLGSFNECPSGTSILGPYYWWVPYPDVLFYFGGPGGSC
jgi:hypothetical protein